MFFLLFQKKIWFEIMLLVSMAKFEPFAQFIVGLYSYPLIHITIHLLSLFAIFIYLPCFCYYGHHHYHYCCHCCCHHHNQHHHQCHLCLNHQHKHHHHHYKLIFWKSPNHYYSFILVFFVFYCFFLTSLFLTPISLHNYFLSLFFVFSETTHLFLQNLENLCLNFSVCVNRNRFSLF